MKQEEGTTNNEDTTNNENTTNNKDTTIEVIKKKESNMEREIVEVKEMISKRPEPEMIGKGSGKGGMGTARRGLASQPPGCRATARPSPADHLGLQFL